MVAITVEPCSAYTWKPYYVKPLYAVGQTLYRCDLARRGFLEAVTIGQILLNPPPYPQVVIYKDTWNTLHNQSDLCPRADAVELKRLYDENVAAICAARVVAQACIGLY